MFSKEEILQKGQYFAEDEDTLISIFRIKLFVSIFNKEVNIEAYNLSELNTSSTQFDLLVKITNEVYEYDSKNLNWIKDKVWEHFNAYMENTNYGFIEYGNHKDDEKANRDYFNINDKHEAFKKANLELIHFDLNQTDYTHFNLSFNCPWEEEHGISICVINGKFEYMD